MGVNTPISDRLEKMRGLRRRGVSKLEEVVIEVTFRCNLDCFFCFNSITLTKDAASNELSTDQIKKVIDKSRELNVPYIRFTGGEPLLRSDIYELLAYARSKGFKEVRINTNGTLVDKSVAKKLEKYVDNVLVALNSYGDELFKRKVNALKLLKKTKIKIVRSGTIALPENIKNFLKIYCVVAKLGLDDWEFYRPIIQKNNKSLTSREEIKVLVCELLKIKKETGNIYPISNAIPFCVLGNDLESMKNVSEVSLGAKYDDGHCRLVVDPRGYIKPSYFIDVNLGNYLEIEKAWNSVFLKKIRELSFVDSTCAGCVHLSVCKAGSRYDSELNHNDYFKMDSWVAIQ